MKLLTVWTFYFLYQSFDIILQRAKCWIFLSQRFFFYFLQSSFQINILRKIFIKIALWPSLKATFSENLKWKFRGKYKQCDLNEPDNPAIISLGWYRIWRWKNKPNLTNVWIFQVKIHFRSKLLHIIFCFELNLLHIY